MSHRARRPGPRGRWCRRTQPWNGQRALRRRVRQLREVLRGQRAQVEPGLARGDLHVLLGAPVLERQIVLRQRADHVEKQPAGHDRLAGRGRHGLELHAQAQLHIGGQELRLPVVNPDQDPGERLNGAASGRGPDRDAQAGEKRFTGNGELQFLPNKTWSDCGCLDVKKAAYSPWLPGFAPVDGPAEGVDCRSRGGGHRVRPSCVRRLSTAVRMAGVASAWRRSRG